MTDTIKALTERLIKKLEKDSAYTPQDFCDDLIKGANKIFDDKSKGLAQSARDLFQNSGVSSKASDHPSLDTVLKLAEIFAEATFLTEDYNKWERWPLNQLADKKMKAGDSHRIYKSRAGTYECCSSDMENNRQEYKKKLLELKREEETAKNLLEKFSEAKKLLGKSAPYKVYYRDRPESSSSYCGMAFGRP